MMMVMKAPGSAWSSAVGMFCGYIPSALLACAALHAGGRVTLLFCLLACFECCYFVHPGDHHQQVVGGLHCCNAINLLA
jgi:hypothetical protein